MYIVIKYQYGDISRPNALVPVYVEGFDSMEKAMEFTKEAIRKVVIDYGFSEGCFCMLDSASDERTPYPYYCFEVVRDNDVEDKAYRFDVIKFSDGNRVYL